ncbi:serine/threonine-protein kinase [Polyangium sp. 15x6]|uniref:serine/threonine-protein kinase n=1 Tax=Polyangium sp. 15x6 TaxID=3042687 RepID=UPI00249B3F20|nr:serine/threonine-protein kinase [Polyangium sp. 15x6]MDI3287802.1 protein kinase [Polyangium sp. 15x6]
MSALDIGRLTVHNWIQRVHDPSPGRYAVFVSDMGTDESLRRDPAPIVLPELRPARRAVPKSLFERYEDIEFVGEGGMGTVYRAVDPRLGRKVALKLLHGDDPELWRRFIGEARSQARIQHEHICPIYEAGQADGEPYIAMQFIDGEPLSVVRQRLALEQCVYLMKEVCLAVHEAHRVGMIHRDIKPGNILVEEREDGTKKPYVMDFGLARQIEDEGQTQSGAVVGTLAFMPPEQARGDVRALDRRSDVYSLGATLYDVIAGRPPFVADSQLRLLLMVGYDDPPPLGKVKAGVPEELETIVMKCLERDPARRYESARALAEDLQRYFDGEPILAKRASFGYVLLKKVKKNKLLTALLVVLALGALAVAGVYARAQRQAAARERLAQELGESVKEMELFLRAAYALPVHDVERERDVVRARLREIEQRAVSAGSVGEGPRHYALGRGHLALGDPEQAREHLERAIAAGYSSADLEYALGHALGELFRRAVEETKRITNEAERKAEVAKLERSLRDPALAHLRAATGVRLESPSYAEGLVALYEGKNEEAIAKAQMAFEQAPWMHEPKKLEGDALFAEGSKYRHDAAFDHEKMKSYFEPAAEAYRVAREIGSSDPEVYRAECELWEKMGWAAYAKGSKALREFEAADAACARAVTSSSRDARARVQRAQAMNARFSVAVDTRGDVDEAERAALSATEDAVRVRPRDPMALYARAATLMRQSLLQSDRGRRASFAAAIDAFQRVLEVDPRFSWALNELGQAYLLQSAVDRLYGTAPRPMLERATKEFERAIVVDPSFSLPVYGMVRAGLHRVEYERDIGADAEAALVILSEAVAQLERQKLGGWITAFWSAKAFRVRATYELSAGMDPGPSITKAVEALRPFMGQAEEGGFLVREMAEIRLVEAEHAFAMGRAPLPELSTERESVRRSITDGEAIDGSALLARMELYVARVAMKEKRASEASFEAAMSPLRPLLSKKRDEPRLYQLLAEIHVQRALWLEEQRKSPAGDVEAGLRMVEKGLALNPRHPMALASRGLLLLVRARSARGEARREAARAASEAFAASFRENPRLAVRYAREAKEASLVE